MMTTISLKSWRECKANPVIGFGFTDKMICGGGDGYDACRGDSGGPLVVNVDGNWTLFGIVSWGIGCGKAGAPGVYTYIPAFLDFINSVY